MPITILVNSNEKHGELLNFCIFRIVYTSSKSIFQSYLTLDKKVSTTTGSKTKQKERLLPSVLFVDAYSFRCNHERNHEGDIRLTFFQFRLKIYFVITLVQIT